MGVQSDQLVYDYLSRVGDLAQATTLTAAERARLVTTLRQTIDNRRGRESGSSLRAERAAMEKILAGLGSPAEVVRDAVHNGVPERPTRAGGRAEARPLPSGPSVPAGPAVPSVPEQPGAPRIETGSGSGPDDWWRLSGERPPVPGDGFRDRIADALGSVPGTGPGAVPGSAGGELPGWRAVYDFDFLHPEVAEERAARVPEQRTSEEDDEEEGEDGKSALPLVPAPARRIWRRPPPAPPAPLVVEVPAPAPRPRLPLVETLALLVLAVAAVLGLWYLALAGWGLAYAGRRLGPRANHTAGLWLPLFVAVLCGLGLYAQVHGHPAGHPLTDARFKADLAATAALWLRLAAGASAAFLAWRISRR